MHGRRWKSRAFFITIIMANLSGCCYFTYQFWNLETPSTALADLESRPNTSEFFDAENKVHFRPTIGELVTFNYTSTLAKDSIFFIENSERESLFPLALCSLESAALHNPSKAVYLLRSTEGATLWTPEIDTLLDNYHNVVLGRFSASRMVLETPVASLWNSQKIEKSRYSLSHASDVLRVAILFKYGGTYVDTDIITLKEHPIWENCPNFVLFEEPGSINGAMMRFQAKHNVLQVIGERLAQFFNPRKWASNGPRLLSTALASQCDLSPKEFASTVSLGPGDKCEDIHSFPPESVFAIHYNDWKWFFQPQRKNQVMTALQSSFATHVWGHFFKQEIQWDLKNFSAFYVLAETNCPKVFDVMKNKE